MKKLILIVFLSLITTLSIFGQNINAEQIINRGVSMIGNTVPNGFQYSHDSNSGRVYRNNEGFTVITVEGKIIYILYSISASNENKLMSDSELFLNYFGNLNNNWFLLGWVGGDQVREVVYWRNGIRSVVITDGREMSTFIEIFEGDNTPI